jgi:DNA topoisomerase IB
MQIIIDENTVYLDDQANDFLQILKDSRSEEDVTKWLQDWFCSVIVPALLQKSKKELVN